MPDSISSISLNPCSDKGRGVLLKGKIGHVSKKGENNTYCCLDKGVALARGGGGGYREHAWFYVIHMKMRHAVSYMCQPAPQKCLLVQQGN